MKLPFPFSRLSHTLSAVAVGVLMTTAQAWGFEERHGKMDWEGTLNLTEEQEEQIDEIEDRYRKSFRELKASEMEKSESKDKRQALYLQMREEMRNVLTADQQKVAAEQVNKRHEERRSRHLDRLSEDLGLSDEQRKELEERLSQRSAAPWPVDKEQRDADRKHFDKSLNAILTDEQKAQWQEMREKHREKWQKHKGEDHHGHKGKEKGDH